MDLKAIHNTRECRAKPAVAADSHDRQPCFSPTTTIGPLQSCVSTSGVHQRVRDFNYPLRKLSTYDRESDAKDDLGWRSHF